MNTTLQLRSSAPRWGMLMGIAGAAIACTSDGSNNFDATPDDGFDRGALLASVSANVMLPTYQAFETQAQALASAVANHADAVLAGAADATTKRTTAQAKWRLAMAAWQRAEMLQVGPAASTSAAVGGRSLRDEIYSWPTTNTCRVDQEVVRNVFEDPNFFARSDVRVNVYGLDALEFLLFQNATDETCPAQVGIDAAWQNLGTAEIQRRRARYAQVLAARIATDAQSLTSAWAAEGDNFTGALTTAGTTSSPYVSAQQAVNELLEALFYLELVVKDDKLAQPLGLRNCQAATCPQSLESPWANHSKENIQANLEGFQLLFFGGSDPATATGFDDFLITLGAPALADSMGKKIDLAVTALNQIGAPLNLALSNEKMSVQNAYDAIKALTDDLKNDFIITLKLQVPSEGAGDND